MKYAIIDRVANGDWCEAVYNTKKEAIKAADLAWARTTAVDKRRRARFFVAKCELDEDGCVNYEAGMDVVKEYT